MPLNYGKNICLFFEGADALLYEDDNITLIKSYDTAIIESEISVSRQLSVSHTGVLFDADELQKELTRTRLFSDLATEYQSSNDVYAAETASIERALNSNYPTDYSLNATIVQQNGEPICWAAVVASIGLEVTGLNYTAEYVSNYMLGELAGAYTYTALLALDSIYNLNGAVYYQAPLFNIIKIETYQVQAPMYVRVYGTSSGDTLNHAIFIDGYTDYSNSVYDGSLKVGDPNYTSYWRIYFTSDQVYSYTLNGIQGYIDQYISLNS